MSARPAAAPSLPSPAEMERMVAQAGLTLNAGQMADLALGWRQIVGLLARLPRARALLDDQAYVFRLAPPAAAPGAVPGARATAKTAAKPAGKPKTAAGAAAKAQPAAARPAKAAPAKTAPAAARPAKVTPPKVTPSAAKPGTSKGKRA
jgi:hypothetical protein